MSLNLDAPLDFSSLLEQKKISPLDVSFALKHHDPASPESFLFLCYASSLFREGHAYLTLQNNQITPTPEEFSSKEFFSLYEKTPPHIKERLFSLQGTHLYFHATLTHNRQLTQRLKKLSEATPLFPVSNVQIPEGLTEEQQFILQKTLSQSLTFISGGPGTGKTFLVFHIIQAFLKAYPQGKVFIGAPTGKASSLLRQKLQNFSSKSVFINTIHSLILEFQTKKGPYPDLLIIDEGSMITPSLLLSLLKYIKGYQTSCSLVAASLIILGDPDQLPPIGIGIGKPMKEWLLSFPENTFKLSIPQRTQNKHLQDLAQKVLRKEPLPAASLPSLKATVQSLASQFIQELSQFNTTELPFNPPFCVLTPMRRGPWGSINLNKLILKQIHSSHSYLPIPIIITTTIPSLNLFNGDTGFLDTKSQQVLFSHRDPLPKQAIPFYSLNYVLSIHKSQGSEYNKVVLLFPPGGDRFDRSLLYTAVTRAKKEIEILADLTIWETFCQKE